MRPCLGVLAPGMGHGTRLVSMRRFVGAYFLSGLTFVACTLIYMLTGRLILEKLVVVMVNVVQGRAFESGSK